MPRVPVPQASRLSLPAAELLREALLRWYDAHRRDLPWRDATDPYAVWISEIMLQQTRVAAVVPYFTAWMARFPTVAALASAPQQEVLHAWQGLGYYSRARNLHHAAQLVVERHNGQVPADVDALRALPGVGPYTAGAIASIAFGLQAPLVDGNVIRVLACLFVLDLDPSVPRNARVFWDHAGALVPADRPGDFNQSLMELGAIVCVPRSPRCDVCPVHSFCQAHKQGRVEDLPIRPKKSAVATQTRRGWALHDPDGRLLVARRPPTGLLADLWELPLDAELAESPSGIQHIVALGDVLHIFTHLRLTVRMYRAQTTSPGDWENWEGYVETRWTTAADRAALPFSTLGKRLLATLDAPQGVLTLPE